MFIIFSYIKLLAACIIIPYLLIFLKKRLKKKNYIKSEDIYIFYFFIMITLVFSIQCIREIFHFKKDLMDIIAAGFVLLLTINDLKEKFSSKNFLFFKIFVFSFSFLFIEIIFQIENLSLYLFVDSITRLFLLSLAIFFIIRWYFLFLFKNKPLYPTFFILTGIVFISYISCFLDAVGHLYELKILYFITIKEYNFFLRTIPTILNVISGILYITYFLRLIYIYKINIKKEGE